MCIYFYLFTFDTAPVASVQEATSQQELYGMCLSSCREGGERIKSLTEHLPGMLPLLCTQHLIKSVWQGECWKRKAVSLFFAVPPPHMCDLIHKSLQISKSTYIKILPACTIWSNIWMHLNYALMSARTVERIQWYAGIPFLLRFFPH